MSTITSGDTNWKVKDMNLAQSLRSGFSFIRGNYAILVVSWILMALGSLIGGVLYEHVSTQMPFFLAIMFTVPQFLITLVLVHEPEQREE